MTRIAVVLLSIAFWDPIDVWCQPAPAESAHKQATAIAHVTVVDATGAPAQSDMTVVISGKRISVLDASKNARIPRKARVIDARGKFLIPGLWDMHVHFRGGKELIRDNEAFLKIFIAYGITGVREMGGDLVDSVLAWRQEIAEGKRLGPRIFTSGPKLDGPKPAWPGSIVVRNPEEGRRAVQQLGQLGVDLVKVYFNEVDHETLQAITQEAAQRKLLVAGHVPRTLLVREVILAGLEDLQHPDFWPGCSTAETSVRDEFVQRSGTDRPMKWLEWAERLAESFSTEQTESLVAFLAQQRVWVTPTLAVLPTALTVGKRDYTQDPRRKYIYPGMWESWNPETGRRRPFTEDTRQKIGEIHRRVMKIMPRLQEAGVGLLAGSDCGASNNFKFPGSGLHEELAALVESGLTPLQALQTATVNAAMFFGVTKDYGTVAKGKMADLVLLDANPLDSIHNTEKIAAVVLNGKLLDRTNLDQLLAEVEAGAREASRR